MDDKADSVRAFTRDWTSGGLTPVGCWSARRQPRCAVVRGVRDAQSVAVSPAGDGVYVAAGNWEPDDFADHTGALIAFRRDAVSGRLSATACFSRHAAPGCRRVGASLAGADRVVVTPDGTGVLVLGSALVMFARDRSSGELTPAGCVTTGGSAGCRNGAVLRGVGIGDGDVFSSCGFWYRGRLARDGGRQRERGLERPHARSPGAGAVVLGLCLGLPGRALSHRSPSAGRGRLRPEPGAEPGRPVCLCERRDLRRRRVVCDPGP